MYSFVSVFFHSADVFEIHPRSCVYQSVVPFHCQIVSRCMAIPLCGCPITVWMDILGSWQFRAMTGKVVMNIWVQIFLLTYIFISLGKYLGAELLSHRIIVCLTF